MSERRSVIAPREAIVHGVAAMVVPIVGMLLLGTTAAALVWRTAALAVALTMVAAALVHIVALGRSEWRRDRPAPRAYVGVVARFLIAFALVVVATW